TCADAYESRLRRELDVPRDSAFATLVVDLRARLTTSTNSGVPAPDGPGRKAYGGSKRSFGSDATKRDATGSEHVPFDRTLAETGRATPRRQQRWSPTAVPRTAARRMRRAASMCERTGRSAASWLDS
ncbi:MAG: hypothetical protein ABIT38_05515, partial [Gemmatimonadaceae bacterium]